MFREIFIFGDTAVDEETFSLILLSISVDTDVDDSRTMQNIDKAQSSHLNSIITTQFCFLCHNCYINKYTKLIETRK